MGRELRRRGPTGGGRGLAAPLSGRGGALGRERRPRGRPRPAGGQLRGHLGAQGRGVAEPPQLRAPLEAQGSRAAAGPCGRGAARSEHSGSLFAAPAPAAKRAGAWEAWKCNGMPRRFRLSGRSLDVFGPFWPILAMFGLERSRIRSR